MAASAAGSAVLSPWAHAVVSGITPTAVTPSPTTSGTARTAAKPVASSPTSTSVRPPIFVLNSLDANVSVIDASSWTERTRIPTGKEPHHLYLTPDEKSVIVANAGADSLTFLDPRTGAVQRTVRGIVDPYHLRFSPDMKWFVTAANRLNHVDFYRWDGENPTLVKRVSSSRTPSHLWIDTKSTIAYVTMQDSDELVAFELATQTEKWRIKTGKMPADVFVTRDDKRLLIGLTGENSVQVFDVTAGLAKPATLMKTIVTGDGAHAFRSAGDGRHVWVSNRVANTVSKLDLLSLTEVDEVKVPGGPDCMDLSPDGKTLYVTSRWAKKLTVVDLAAKQVIRQINVGRSPHGVWTLEHARRD